MADVLNTETLEMRQSVNEGSAPYDSPPWIVITREQYNLWSVIPLQYRKWVTDHIEEMSQPEKDSVDAALLQAQLDGVVQIVDQQGEILRAFMLMVLDEFNLHSTLSNGIKSAIDAGSTLAQIKTPVAALSPVPTRTAQQVRAALRAKLTE
jgi:hypothetical protein